MKNLSLKTDIKVINAHKRKLNWGDIPEIYRIVSTSVSNLGGILTYGFESGYKNILDKRNWNLTLLKGTKDTQGDISVEIKPTIAIRHIYNNIGYELHAFPVVEGEKVNYPMKNDPQCPFNEWLPHDMQLLFRINSLVAYIQFCVQSGDEADMELLKHTHYLVDALITILKDSFTVVEVRGYSIAEFYQEILKRKGTLSTLDDLITPASE